MKESFITDESDLALVHALQVSPRASFVALGKVFGESPLTVSRRWHRLRTEGLAWIAATPSAGFLHAGCIAYVKVRCQPAHLEQTADALCREVAVSSLDIVGGGADLLLTLTTHNMPALYNFFVQCISRISGVISTELFLATRGYREGGSWRLDSLTNDQIAALRPPKQMQTSVMTFTETDTEILHALGEDGRMPLSDVAERAGTSPATARRRIERMLASGAVALRCDMAGWAFGWPIFLYLSARVASGRLNTIARAVSSLPGIRLVSTVTGTANLFISASLRTLDAVSDLEETIGHTFPEWEPLDRTVVMQPKKRAGVVLDSVGKKSHTVPMFGL